MNTMCILSLNTCARGDKRDKTSPKEGSSGCCRKDVVRETGLHFTRWLETTKFHLSKVIKSIFQFSKKKRPDEIKLRAGNYKLISIRHEKSKFAIMVIDADEEFDTYEHETERVSEILKNKKLLAVALKTIEN